MAATSSFFGGGLDLGPCNIYWDVNTGGANIDLGGVDRLVIRFGVEKTDLFYAQYGADAADRVTTRTYCEIECGLAQATLERMEAITQGFELNLASDDVTPVGYSFGPSIGERDSDIAKQIRLVRVSDSIESTDPMQEIIVFKAAPASTVELTYDAATQRYQGVMFKCYRDPNFLSPAGKPMFFGGGIWA